MIYVPEDYGNYKYLVDHSDNYVVLSNSRSVSGTYNEPDSADVIIQYFKPSTYTITSSINFYNSREFETVDVSSDFYDRADCPSIMNTIYLSIFFILFILNGLTKFVKKGGIFFG